MTTPMASWPASPRPPRTVPGGQSGWWLEDAVQGRTIEHAHGRTVDAAEHVWLAWVTDNVSDVHGDAHRAAAGEFGQPLVLGALTVAIVIGLAEPALSDPGLVANVVGRGWRSITLRGPVVPGDTLRAVSRITAVGPPDVEGWGRVTRTITGYNQRGEQVATIEEVDRGVPSRSGPATNG
jgi:acyl dehydratase